MVTLMPPRLIACVARTASAISVPGTKRLDTWRPSEERSAKFRRDGFSERCTKKALNIPHLENYLSRPIGGGGSEAQKVVSQRAWVRCQECSRVRTKEKYPRCLDADQELSSVEPEINFFRGRVCRGFPLPLAKRFFGRLYQHRIAALCFD